MKFPHEICLEFKNGAESIFGTTNFGKTEKERTNYLLILIEVGIELRMTKATWQVLALVLPILKLKLFHDSTSPLVSAFNKISILYLYCACQRCSKGFNQCSQKNN